MLPKIKNCKQISIKNNIKFGKGIFNTQSSEQYNEWNFSNPKQLEPSKNVIIEVFGIFVEVLAHRLQNHRAQ